MLRSLSFSTLPSELRIKVWKEALENESDTRLVVTYFPEMLDPGTHILPHAGLLSPLLTVSLESRHCALAFYSLRLPVYPLFMTLERYLATPKQNNSSGRVGLHYPSRQATASSIVSRRVGVAIMAFQGVCRRPADLPMALGALYLNPGRDVFVYPYRSDGMVYGTQYYKRLYGEGDRSDKDDEDKGGQEIVEDRWLTPAFSEPQFAEQVASRVTRVLLVGGHGPLYNEPWMGSCCYEPHKLMRFPNCLEARHIQVEDPADTCGQILHAGLYKCPDLLRDKRLGAWVAANDFRQNKTGLSPWA
ncbi:hypothetical protein PG999_004581 [Apiospora kogelbergensis]|uniref:2EXR domain-containing protein n=1 Tax=Apiospora kogelbergensis TaxID=1337665 RepID=A0AAW0QZM9_9PEZI